MVLTAEVQTILEELHSALQKLYGDRLLQVILYGSWARNDASDESDHD